MSFEIQAVLAHGLGQINRLPVPLWLFYSGAAIVLVVSFVMLGVLWKKPLLERPRERPLPRALQRGLRSRFLRVLLGGVSFALLVVVVVAGVVGDDSPTLNIAPTFVYVAFWVGVPFLSVLLGNVWSVLNPWRAAADAVAFLAERVGLSWRPPLLYPEGLGHWPAAFMLASFVTLELAYTEPAVPQTIAVATLVYSWMTWTGAAAFGRREWFEKGDGFSAYFGLLARLSPVHSRGRELVVRVPLTGLTGASEAPGTIALVSVILGSVGFDGLSRTNLWVNLVHAESAAKVITTNVIGLAILIVFVAVTYLAAIEVARALTGGGRELRSAFLTSLIPIAFAYLVAHYFSLFVLQGQYMFPLISDPFGYGWDLFGTADSSPNLNLLAPETMWYVQVGALVVGHVAGLVLAHDRALSLFPDVRSALRAQYAMLALMVLYTVGGMWILSRP